MENNSENDLHNKVLKILLSVMPKLNVTADEWDKDLSGAGMDSIGFIQSIVALEEAFDCEIPDSKLLMSELNTINKICEVISGVSQ